MLDYQGNILDEYISTSNRRVGVWDIVKTRDGGLACASAATDGDFITPENKSYVEKLDSNLNQVWDYTIDWRFSSSNVATSIDETPNGDIIVGGNVVDFIFDPDTAGKYGYMQKLSAQGDSIWYKAYKYYNNVTIRERHSLFDLQFTHDAIYFVGDANDFDTTPPPGQSLWLVSTDSNGIINSLDEDFFVYDSKVIVYPNPTSNDITINPGYFEGNVTFSLYDLQGRLQIKQMLKAEESTISLSNLPQGLYLYEINQDGKVSRGKIVKN
jgi:hypothetical protein